MIDTNNIIIFDWLFKHPDVFDSDKRFNKVSMFGIKREWKALLQLMRKQWRKRHVLSLSTFRRWLHEESGRSIDVIALLDPFIDAIEQNTEPIAEEDFLYAMDELWLKTRKLAASDAIGSALTEMQKPGQFDLGLAVALESIDEVKSMGDVQSAGISTLSELAQDGISTYDKPNHIQMPTGLTCVDVALSGIRKGQLWMLCGYAAQGKTQTAKEIAYNLIRDGRNVLFVSLEMTCHEVRWLFETRHAQSIKHGVVKLRDVCEKTLEGEAFDVYWQAAMELADPEKIGGNLTVWVPNSDVTVDEVVRRAEAMHYRKKIDVLVIDYSELLISQRQREQYRIELGDTIRRCKTAALQFAGGEGVGVLLLHQISRSGFEKALKRGYHIMPDLAETSLAERAADVILWVLRTDEMKEASEMHIGVAKGRMVDEILSKGAALYEDFAHSYIGNTQSSNDYLRNFKYGND